MHNLNFTMDWAEKQKNSALLQELCSQEERLKALRNKNLPTVPFALGEELQLNPFLLARNVEEFKEIRMARNLF